MNKYIEIAQFLLENGIFIQLFKKFDINIHFIERSYNSVSKYRKLVIPFQKLPVFYS